jgi:hypothetical protein
MTIKDEQPANSNYLAIYMLGKVLQPLNSQFVGCLAVVADCNCPVSWDRFLFIPSRQVILASKDEERWDSLASSVDSLDQSHPLTITRLDRLWPASSL